MEQNVLAGEIILMETVFVHLDQVIVPIAIPVSRACCMCAS
jgi:hypothetical protein